MRLLREIDVDRECERDPGSSSGGIYSFNGHSAKDFSFHFTWTHDHKATMRTAELSSHINCRLVLKKKILIVCRSD